MSYIKKIFNNDPYYCNTEVKRFGRFLPVTNIHLDALDDNKIYYMVIRKFVEAGFGNKVYYNISVNNTKLYEAVGLIDKVNEMKRKPVTAYFMV